MADTRPASWKKQAPSQAVVKLAEEAMGELKGRELLDKQREENKAANASMVEALKAIQDPALSALRDGIREYFGTGIDSGTSVDALTINPQQYLESTEPLVFFSHRSGHETGQYCPRKRYLHYHLYGTGVNLFPPIYFDIGTSVHYGLGYMCIVGRNKPDGLNDMPGVIDTALTYFRGTPVYATLDPFARLEQETLIEGLLWAFYYRAWPGFIKKFEILFVEESSDDEVEFTVYDQPAVLHLLSRPDVIVKDRQTGEVVAINWKTINDVTEERQENITNSLQVNLEAYYAEKLYTKYLESEYTPQIPKGMKGQALMTWLEKDLADYRAMQPQVAYTQIVYLVKGPRKRVQGNGQDVVEGDDTVVADDSVWRQDSPLCYRYVNLGDAGPKGRSKKTTEEFPEVAWCSRYYKEGNVGHNLLGAGYAKQPIWEVPEPTSFKEAFAIAGDTAIALTQGITAVQDHVHEMNAGRVFPSTLPDPRNLTNPLDAIVIFETPIMRDRERQESFREQVICQEMRVAKSLVTIGDAMAFVEVDPPMPFDVQARSLNELLDEHFPQQLISCRKPTRCEFHNVCNGPQETRRPVMEMIQIVEGGRWQARQPHHAAERRAFGLDGDTVAE